MAGSKGIDISKKKKSFSILSVIFTAIAFVGFLLLTLVTIYTLTLGQGLTSVLIAFGMILTAGWLTLWVLVFGGLGGVFGGLALKKQEVKKLNVTMLVSSGTMVVITLNIVVAFFVFAILVS